MQHPADDGRHTAKGGWQRALIGFAMGAAAGLVAALVMPRDEGPVRTLNPDDRPRPISED